jgi:hypothetical protein
MLTLMILSTLFGAILGTRFKVFVLFPAIFTSAALIAGAGVAHGGDVWSIALAVTVCITGLQIGFLAGIAIRVAAARAPRLPGDHAAASSSAG